MRHLFSFLALATFAVAPAFADHHNEAKKAGETVVEEKTEQIKAKTTQEEAKFKKQVKEKEAEAVQGTNPEGLAEEATEKLSH